jgi:hypothetical protein
MTAGVPGGTMTPIETRQKGSEMSSRTSSGGTTGWAVFAGMVLVIVGSINIIFGLAAIFQDDVLTATGSGRAIVWDLTAWGWILFLFGTFQLLAGFALFGGAGWARWTAIVLAGLNAIANVGFITVYPLWTLLIVALDVIVIYQLSAGWAPAGTRHYTDYESREGGATAARDEMTRLRTGL